MAGIILNNNLLTKLWHNLQEWNQVYPNFIFLLEQNNFVKTKLNKCFTNDNELAEILSIIVYHFRIVSVLATILIQMCCCISFNWSFSAV